MVRFLLDLSVGALLGALIGMIPAVHTLGRNALDAFQVFEPEEAARHVVLVNITPKTFREKFCGRSPLDPETLLGLLKKLADVDPLLIAVDIDTSHRDFERIETSLGSNAEVGKTPVIWARGGSCGGKDCEEQKFELGKVLADARPEVRPSRFGLAVFKRERDGMVREFTRCVQAYIAGSVHEYPTFHWSIVQSIGSDPGNSRPVVREPHNPCEVKVSDDRLVLPRIRYQFAEVDAGELIDVVSCDKRPDDAQPCADEPGEDVRPDGSDVEDPSAGSDSGDATNGTPRDSLTPTGERKDIFKDKIVLVGGAYDQRDKHQTAFGEIDGYYLLARAIEAERSGRLTRKEPAGIRLAMDVGLALLIASFHYLFVQLFAGLLTALLMTLIPIVVSFQLFAGSDYWLDALPFLIGFWVTEAYFAGPLTAVVEKIFPDRAPLIEERTELVIEEEIANDGSGRRNIRIQGWRRWRARILGPKA